MSYKVGVLIGRFSGYHAEHHEHIKRAAAENDMVLVLVGSANQRRSIKNPFSASQRIDIILRNVSNDADLSDTRIRYATLADHPDMDTWIQQVRMSVGLFSGNEDEITIYGCEKDATSFYVNCFPEWKTSLTKKVIDVDATEIRKLWFEGQQTIIFLRDHPHISDITKDWLTQLPFQTNVQDEWNYYRAEAEKFKDYPYPETLNFNCGDAVVVANNCVLMIRRKFNPGKNCVALPGGFKNANETFFDAAFRELFEETGIQMSQLVLMESLVGTQLFDDPSRSLGIPRSTLAAYFDISWMYDRGQFPEVSPQDDAAEVFWVPIDDLVHMDNVYDDHGLIVYNILKTFKG